MLKGKNLLLCNSFEHRMGRCFLVEFNLNIVSSKSAHKVISPDKCSTLWHWISHGTSNGGNLSNWRGFVRNPSKIFQRQWSFHRWRFSSLFLLDEPNNVRWNKYFSLSPQIRRERDSSLLDEQLSDKWPRFRSKSSNDLLKTVKNLGKSCSIVWI